MNKRLQTLFFMKVLQEISPEEKEELLLLMADESNEKQVNELMESHWQAFEAEKNAPVFSSAQVDSLLNKLLAKHVKPQPLKYKKSRLWPRIAVAAALAAGIIAVGLIFYSKQANNSYIVNSVQQDIDPGIHGATLKLANGKIIKLNADITQAQKAGLIISKNEKGQFIYELKAKTDSSSEVNVLSTAMGENVYFKLPDGSLVMLNAASRLTYSAHLSPDGKRKVELEGEGYFEIAKDKNHPFIVKSRGQEIEVLGTHFNVNTYNNEPGITTTLLEGIVVVITKQGRRLIQPGEQTIFNSSGLQVRKANLEHVMSWVRGDFYLNHVDLKTAMSDISRWYNVEVIYQESLPNDMETGGWIARDKPLSAVLKSIEASGLVKFKIDKRKVYVTK